MRLHVQHRPLCVAPPAGRPSAEATLTLAPVDEQGGGGPELAAMLLATVAGLFLVFGAVELSEGRGVGVWLILGLAMSAALFVAVLRMAQAHGRGPVRALRSHIVRQKARVLKGIAVAVLALLLLGIVGGWLYSHLDAENFGECKRVALSIGTNPTIRECQPFGASDFLVPFVAVALLLVVVSGEGNLTIDIPWLGRLTKEAKEAVKLAENPADQRLLDEKGETFVQTVKPG